MARSKPHIELTEWRSRFVSKSFILASEPGRTVIMQPKGDITLLYVVRFSQICELKLTTLHDVCLRKSGPFGLSASQRTRPN